ncbi:YcxB family protein [Bittarella massiliensis (ex Durand et al. 2017)]|uniref:YcxB family protein n=1 Tax=Bittarella massiliensis (ex Durand et al. 2017) TaxID=1720313 RepID=UPI001AA0FFA4|nr:YcxB family protein [Bittarella massiliensis (ex Durand et al. 2017)]MBO1680250.1 YcxB family protein [Bittarella massiliensis (ex Durand et al. 2017)]
MSKESPILKVTFQMDFNDFYNFNMHISKEMIDKSKKKVTIFGIVEIVMAVVFLVLNFSSESNSSLNLVLAVALLCMGLFSVLFYPAFFERQLSKAVKKTFDQNEYFHNDVTLEFLEDKIFETSCVGTGSVAYKDLQKVYRLGDCLILRMSKEGGYVLPLKAIGEEKIDQIEELVRQKMDEAELEEAEELDREADELAAQKEEGADESGDTPLERNGEQ